MKHAATAALALFAVGLTAEPVAACKGYRETQTAELPTIDVGSLARLLQKKDAVTVYDANGVATRAKYGVIPGAKLLSHYSSFDVAKELPAKKEAKLVFYCGGPRCSAAEKSARKAMDAGYQDVSVMKDGIKGWAGAGRATEKPASQS